MSLFLCLPRVLLTQYCQKMSKVGGSEQTNKLEDGHKGGGGRGIIYRRGVQTFCTLC